MHTIIAIIELIIVCWVVRRFRRQHRYNKPRPEKAAQARPASTRTETPHINAGTGLLIGHVVRRGNTGFPGDPLPDGHLGTPQNVAFWAGIGDDDEDD